MSEMLSYLKGYTKNIKDTDDFVSICENVLNNEEQVKFVQLLQLLDWI
jgi:hypothetical protein